MKAPWPSIPPSLEALERAVETLLREPKIRNIWQADDVWGMVANMVATLPESPTSLVRRALSNRLEQLRSPGDALVALAIANVAWEGPPLAFANMVIGELGDSWRDKVNKEAGSRPSLDRTQAERWLAIQAGTYGASSDQPKEPAEDDTRNAKPSKDVWPDRSALERPPVVMACWLRSQCGLAIRQATERLQELIDLALLLEPEPQRIHLFSGRGSANQPGLRGLRIDRGAVGAALANHSAGGRELAAVILHNSRITPFVSFEWYGLEPLPLHTLIGPTDRQRRISKSLQAVTPFALRIRTAARWYTQAHWAENPIDRALALGIALDALVGDPNGLPLLATSERFALLEPNPELRGTRAKTFRDFYGVSTFAVHSPAAAHAAWTSRISVEVGSRG
jgi:hypothetical protein